MIIYRKAYNITLSAALALIVLFGAACGRHPAQHYAPTSSNQTHTLREIRQVETEDAEYERMRAYVDEHRLSREEAEEMGYTGSADMETYYAKGPDGRKIIIRFFTTIIHGLGKQQISRAYGYFQTLKTLDSLSDATRAERLKDMQPALKAMAKEQKGVSANASRQLQDIINKLGRDEEWFGLREPREEAESAFFRILQDWQEELAKEENWQQQRIKELSVELRRVEVACESLFKYTRAGQGDPVKLITRRKDGLEFKTSSLFDLPGEDSVEREFYTALYEFIQNLEQELSQGQAPTATQAESPHSTGNPTATSSLRRVRGVERQRLHKGIKIGSVITERGEHLHICISNEVEKVAYFYNDREEVVGSVIFDWNDESRIATFILIDVRPDCKGRGYSSAMFEALLLGFRQGIFSEHPVLYFSTSVVTNPFAARVFAKYGFRPDAGEEGIILTVSKARGANGKFQVRDLFSGGFLQAN